MATYKVLQDVEAEDKLLGPLTLRQFIYAGMTAISLYLTYFMITHHAAFMAVVFLPMAVLTGFFAFPWGRDQPTEIWALAKIRFLLKPRRRIWDQSGVKELVTITVPKQTNINYTNGLSESEVRSRLRALADTIDSRGWAIKNANLNIFAQPALVMGEPTSDRLVGPSSLPQEVTGLDIQASDDILDEKNNSRAKQVDDMIEASSRAHRQKIVDNLKKENPTLPPPPQAPPVPPPPAPTNNYWFLNQPSAASGVPDDMVTFNTQVVTPGMTQAEMPAAPTAAQPTPDEEELVHELDARKQTMPTTAYYSHLHTIQPLSAQQQQRQQAAMPIQATQHTPVSGEVAAMPPAPPYASMTNGPIRIIEQPLPSGAPSAASGVRQSLPSPGPIAPPVAQQQQPAPMAAPPVQQMGGTPPPPTPWQPPAQPPVTPANQAAILQLANNDDLNVATLAREAQRSTQPDEVVIKLH
jgi:hypothetical protein